ncbi:hypothetical protein JCM1840_000075 [Sporobolomyces johnsonii]
MFPRLAAALRTRSSVAVYSMAAPIVVVTESLAKTAAAPDANLNSASRGDPKAHHKAKGGFVNPWPSFQDPGTNPLTLWQIYRDWKSQPVPPPAQLPPLVQPSFTPPADLSQEEREDWYKDIKSTWLGHACYLVELGIAPGTPGVDKDGEKRGYRILFDPVWSHRCSPSQWVGPARVVEPPIALEDIPHVDAVVISHNHYDHLDVATLKHLYKAQPAGSIHFFAPLGNAKWFRNTIGVKASEVTELDWWEERTLQLGAGKEGVQGGEALRVVCTPCQHFTGRGIHDRNDTLWASWSVSSATGGKVWFAGDTGYKTVPRGATSEGGLPTCPAFKEIGEREGPFDFSMIPIGAYSPRKVHCSPEDSVELHREVKSRKSLGMHHSTWVLTDEEMTEPPRRLRAACDKYGISQDEFGICGLGETVRHKVHA